MGLFDSVLGAVNEQVQQQGGLGTVLSNMLDNSGELGGLGGLVEKFKQAGLGEAVQSWIGVGANQSITGNQLSDALGSDVLTKAAGQLGLDPSQLSGQLAQILPGLIDKLTPNGSMPEGGLGNAGDLMGMLGGFLGKA